MDMLRYVAALFVLALLDALSTYVVVASGVGVEANPAVADVINSNPAAVFPLALVSAAVPAVALYVAVWLSRMLPAQPRAATARLVTAAFFTMITWRVAVVVNNVLILLPFSH
jgi:uncharacterized BrkB/YihY/UPF0761 family membrane protein